MNQRITARFPSCTELEAALCDLRRLGAVHALPAPGSAPAPGAPTLHLTVRSADASLARAVVRRAGGQLIS